MSYAVTWKIKVYLHPLTSLFIFCRFLVWNSTLQWQNLLQRTRVWRKSHEGHTFNCIQIKFCLHFPWRWDFSKLQLEELKQDHVAKSRILFLMFMPVCLLWPKRVIKCRTSSVGEDRVRDWGTCSHSLVSSDVFVKSQETALASPVYSRNCQDRVPS